MPSEEQADNLLDSLNALRDELLADRKHQAEVNAIWDARAGTEQQIGVVAVDAGLVMLGDPGYTLCDDGSNRADVGGGNWHRFCAEVLDQSFHDVGHKQIGSHTAVVVRTGYGDGLYPVFVRFNSEGYPVELRVVFEEADTRADDEEMA